MLTRQTARGECALNACAVFCVRVRMNKVKTMLVFGFVCFICAERNQKHPLLHGFVALRYEYVLRCKNMLRCEV